MKSSGEKKPEAEWIEWEKADEKAKLLTVGEARKAIFRPTPGFEERTFDNSRFSVDRNLIYAFAVPHHEQNLSEMFLSRWTLQNYRTYFVRTSVSGSITHQHLTQ